MKMADALCAKLGTYEKKKKTRTIGYKTKYIFEIKVLKLIKELSKHFTNFWYQANES